MTRKNILLLVICMFLMSAFGAEASEQIRLGITPFVSKSSEIKANQVARINDIMIKILQASPSISVIERERFMTIAREHSINLGSGEQNSAMKLGQLAGCRYILLGSATQLTQRYISSKKATQFLLDTFYDDESESQEATATIEARLVDVTTGKVVLSFSKSGSVLISDKARKSSSELTSFALEAAASRLGNKIREVLANEYSMIISINRNNIRINRGSASGVNIGALYRVYQEGEELFDLNGQSLGKKMINLAILRVTKVNDEFSTVEVLKDGRQVPQKSDNKKSSKTKKVNNSKNTSILNLTIREGDKVEAISFSEAEKIKLATQRIGG